MHPCGTPDTSSGHFDTSCYLMPRSLARLSWRSMMLSRISRTNWRSSQSSMSEMEKSGSRKGAGSAATMVLDLKPEVTWGTSKVSGGKVRLDHSLYILCVNNIQCTIYDKGYIPYIYIMIFISILPTFLDKCLGICIFHGRRVLECTLQHISTFHQSHVIDRWQVFIASPPPTDWRVCHHSQETDLNFELCQHVSFSITEHASGLIWADFRLSKMSLHCDPSVWSTWWGDEREDTGMCVCSSGMAIWSTRKMCISRPRLFDWAGPMVQVIVGAEKLSDTGRPTGPSLPPDLAHWSIPPSVQRLQSLAQPPSLTYTLTVI